MESQFFSKDNYNIIFNTVNKNLFLDKGLDSKPILNEMKLKNECIILTTHIHVFLFKSILKIGFRPGNMLCPFSKSSKIALNMLYFELQKAP